MRRRGTRGDEDDDNDRVYPHTRVTVIRAVLIVVRSKVGGALAAAILVAHVGLSIVFAPWCVLLLRGIGEWISRVWLAVTGTGSHEIWIGRKIKE